MLEEITPAIILLYSFSLLSLIIGWTSFFLRPKINQWVLSVERNKLLNEFIYIESEMKRLPICDEKERLYEQTVILKQKILEINGTPIRSKTNNEMKMPEGVTSIFSIKNNKQNRKVS
ncbi:hypothetical protein [Pseudoalteromonas spongiae]|uniref:hypothetical protein n=1 Tax=Pseudoalteromonas spongiae TaxID=298657 RepID=UPI000C2D483C|nr:hypothetical protein [Pseudoalteromonas spongiae]